jgi:hypothetical protein
LYSTMLVVCVTGGGAGCPGAAAHPENALLKGRALFAVPVALVCPSGA